MPEAADWPTEGLTTYLFMHPSAFALFRKALADPVYPFRHFVVQHVQRNDSLRRFLTERRLRAGEHLEKTTDEDVADFARRLDWQAVADFLRRPQTRTRPADRPTPVPVPLRGWTTGALASALRDLDPNLPLMLERLSTGDVRIQPMVWNPQNGSWQAAADSAVLTTETACYKCPGCLPGSLQAAPPGAARTPGGDCIRREVAGILHVAKDLLAKPHWPVRKNSIGPDVRAMTIDCFTCAAASPEAYYFTPTAAVDRLLTQDPYTYQNTDVGALAAHALNRAAAALGLKGADDDVPELTEQQYHDHVQALLSRAVDAAAQLNASDLDAVRTAAPDGAGA